MDPVQKKRHIRQRYDEESYVAIYDRRYQKAQFQKATELFTIITRAKTVKYGNKCTGTMLDYGAGTGLLWEYLHQQKNMHKSEILQNRLIAIDLSWGMLKKFADKLQTAQKAQNPPLFGTDLICCDGEVLPLRGQQFSHVIALTSLQNLPDLPQGLLEIQHVMESDGWFGLTYLRKSMPQSVLENHLKQVFTHFQVAFSDREKKSADIEDWICLVAP